MTLIVVCFLISLAAGALVVAASLRGPHIPAHAADTARHRFHIGDSRENS